MRAGAALSAGATEALGGGASVGAVTGFAASVAAGAEVLGWFEQASAQSSNAGESMDFRVLDMTTSVTPATLRPPQTH
jgi:hypothetical protein